MFAAVKFVLGGPLLQIEAVQRAVAGVNVDAGNTHVSSPIMVVAYRASAAFGNSGIAAG
jgi:hypothetical protein